MPKEAAAPVVKDFRVRSDSDPRVVGSAIAKAVECGNYPRIKVVGHGAIGQCVKAIAIASHFCRISQNVHLACTLSFESVPDSRKGGEMSAMVFQTFQQSIEADG